jgi:hypothetical protein
VRGRKTLRRAHKKHPTKTGIISSLSEDNKKLPVVDGNEALNESIIALVAAHLQPVSAQLASTKELHFHSLL